MPFGGHTEVQTVQFSSLQRNIKDESLIGRNK